VLRGGAPDVSDHGEPVRVVPWFCDAPAT
jgi:hypothetical protein